MNTCRYCNKAYEAKRSTSKYCGPKCRKLAFQSDSVPATAENAKRLLDAGIMPDEFLNGPIDLSCDTNPNTTQPVTLSDGQQFYLDPRPAQHIAEHRQGAGTPYQQQLATLSLQYDILKGSDKARARAKQVLDKEGGAWC